MMEVVAAIEDETTLAILGADVASEDEGEYGLVDFWLAEREWASTNEIGYILGWLLHIEVENMTCIIERIGLWIDIDSLGEWTEHGAPTLALQGIHIGIDVIGIEDDDAAIVVIVDDASLGGAIVQKLAEADVMDAIWGNAAYVEDCFGMIHAFEVGEIEWIAIQNIGDALSDPALLHEDASGGWEEDCIVYLDDGFWIGADVSGGWLTSDIGAFGGWGEHPDSLIGEGIERSISKLTLTNGAGIDGDGIYDGGANLHAVLGLEDERILGFANLDHGNGAISDRGILG